MLIIENAFLLKIYVCEMYFNESYIEKDKHKISSSGSEMPVKTDALLVRFYQGHGFNQNKIKGSGL